MPWLSRILPAFLVLLSLTETAHAQAPAPTPSALPAPPPSGAGAVLAAGAAPEAGNEPQAREPPAPQSVPVPPVPPAPVVPPGYMLVPMPAPSFPVVSQDQRQQAGFELAHIEQRLAELNTQRPGLAGPIALTAVGGGGAFVTAYIGFVWWTVVETETSYDGDQNGGPRVMVAMSTLFLGGLIGGLVWLGKTVKKRRVHAPEIKALRRRQRDLDSILRYGFSADANGGSLRLNARF
jgi:hypothetical protein